jgi:ABC-type uncharacterized transport system ATPase subunit
LRSTRAPAWLGPRRARGPYKILADGASKGGTCIVISSDLDELTQICDRVLAFSAGKIVGELSRDELTVETLIQEISGAAAHAAAQRRDQASPP